MTTANTAITDQNRADAHLIWNYHQMGHELNACDVAIGLGSHDLGVAEHAAKLYHDGLFPLLVFTGATSPTSAARFPRGEAVHYRERALQLGVPDDAILVEPDAANTGDNIRLSCLLLDKHGIVPTTVLVVSKPYMQRRAFATCGAVWPEVDVVCASEELALADYVRSIGDEKLVIDMLVGDLQRVVEYPKLGFATDQHVPVGVTEAYDRLLEGGFDSRLLR
ncbi:YdcF family protein [Umezawaea endophytica]|uniref:YdcF family protein n=1 Tax=Umezawaea endophytica TaxID=1654476 RepID=A0A9X2VN39_9PSEU|nr:YdcF family protein [Umezawaea endophytica]MCS7479169.1 YdcF family protein [Umezawaea endophytica]